MGGGSGDTTRRNTGAFPRHAQEELESQCLSAVKIDEGCQG